MGGVKCGRRRLTDVSLPKTLRSLIQKLTSLGNKMNWSLEGLVACCPSPPPQQVDYQHDDDEHQQSDPHCYGDTVIRLVGWTEVGWRTHNKKMKHLMSH